MLTQLFVIQTIKGYLTSVIEECIEGVKLRGMVPYIDAALDSYSPINELEYE